MARSLCSQGLHLPELAEGVRGAVASRKNRRESCARKIGDDWCAGSPGGSFGTHMLGPVLLELGSHEQKLRFLPDIAAGRTVWAQGYSEPGAGSDLAGLQTRAVRNGDEYVINGSKIWTTGAKQCRLDVLSGSNRSRGGQARRHQLHPL